jgi:glycerophosphoryl diester phosphodiesterase
LTLIASHRGGSLEAPENSPTSFRHTAGLAVEQVEFDIHPTADGQIVVIHDATLDRTTNGTGKVAARTLAELRALTIAGTADDRIMTLGEVIELFRPTGIALRMEVKSDVEHQPYPGLLDHALRLLDAAGMRGRTVVTSFLAPVVGQAVQAPGLLGRIWLVSPVIMDDCGLEGVVATAEAHAIGHVGIRANRLDARVAAHLRAAGLGVGAWAVNDEASVRKVLELGMEVFTTDIPTRALALRAERNGS